MENAYLILCVERNNASFVRADNRLTSFDDVGICLALKFVGYQEQEEASLQQVYAEEKRHEAEIWIEFEDVVESFRG